MMHRKRIVILIAIAAVLLFGWNTYQQQRLATDNKDQSEQIGAQQQLIDGLADQLDSAADQGADVATPEEVAETVDGAADQGADVATPEEVAETVDGAEVSAIGPQGERGPIGETGPAGEPGAGPTTEQIEAAIAVYCSTRNQCREPISQADIVTAVTAYCFPDGCRGFEGALGAQGPPGEQGRPPTTAEIEAAVYAYLAANPPVAGSPGPQGPQGDPGATGSQGDPGPVGPTGPAGADGQPGVNGTNGTNGQTPTAMTCTETAPLSGVYTCTVTATS